MWIFKFKRYFNEAEYNLQVNRLLKWRWNYVSGMQYEHTPWVWKHSPT
jgi:hypothetical protein